MSLTTAHRRTNQDGSSSSMMKMRGWHLRLQPYLCRERLIMFSCSLEVSAPLLWSPTASSCLHFSLLELLATLLSFLLTSCPFHAYNLSPSPFFQLFLLFSFSVLSCLFLPLLPLSSAPLSLSPLILCLPLPLPPTPLFHFLCRS